MLFWGENLALGRKFFVPTWGWVAFSGAIVGLLIFLLGKTNILQKVFVMSKTSSPAVLAGDVPSLIEAFRGGNISLVELANFFNQSVVWEYRGIEGDTDWVSPNSWGTVQAAVADRVLSNDEYLFLLTSFENYVAGGGRVLFKESTPKPVVPVKKRWWQRKPKTVKPVKVVPPVASRGNFVDVGGNSEEVLPGEPVDTTIAVVEPEVVEVAEDAVSEKIFSLLTPNVGSVNKNKKVSPPPVVGGNGERVVAPATTSVPVINNRVVSPPPLIRRVNPAEKDSE